MSPRYQLSMPACSTSTVQILVTAVAVPAPVTTVRFDWRSIPTVVDGTCFPSDLWSLQKVLVILLVKHTVHEREQSPSSLYGRACSKYCLTGCTTVVVLRVEFNSGQSNSNNLSCCELT